MWVKIGDWKNLKYTLWSGKAAIKSALAITWEKNYIL